MDTERLRIGAGITVIGAVLLLVGHSAGDDGIGAGLWSGGWVVLVIGLLVVAVSLLRGRPE